MTELESVQRLTEIWAEDAWHHDTVRGLTHVTALTVMHIQLLEIELSCNGARRLPDLNDFKTWLIPLKKKKKNPHMLKIGSSCPLWATRKYIQTKNHSSFIKGRIVM